MASEFINDDAVHAYDVLGFSEHHLASNKMQTLEDAFKRVKRRSLAVPAVPSLRSDAGTSGGVVLAPRRHLQILAQGKSLCMRGEDYVGFILRLRGVDVLILQLYLISSIGPRGRNVSRLSAIS